MGRGRAALIWAWVFAAAGLSLGARWARTYGGNDLEFPYAIDKTSDGGFIVAGQTQSSGSLGYRDIEVLKLDGRGNVQWHRLFGGPCDEGASAVRQTPDGGYIVVGYTGAFCPQFADLYLLRLTPAGDVVWQKTLGGIFGDGGDGLDLTPDGGFIVVGGGASFPRGDDYWVLKLNGNGEVLWQRLYGGSNSDSAYRILRTSDGGYVVAGLSFSFVAGSNSSVWIVKLNGAGDLLWQRTYGNGNIYARSIDQAPDGGYIVLAETYAAGSGMDDAWVLKLGSAGDIQWQYAIGGPGTETADSIIAASDGGYLFSGTTSSYGHGGNDLWLVKLSSTGDILWQRTYGAGKNDGASGSDTLLETEGGSLVVGGYTDNWGAGKSDMWVLRLFADGTLGEGSPIVGTAAAQRVPTTVPALPTATTYLITSVTPVAASFQARPASLTATLVAEAPLVPPSGVVLRRDINRNLFRREAFHTISWSEDPRDEKYVLTAYRVYRKEVGQPDGSYALVGEVSGSTLSWVDRYLDVKKAYVYVIRAVEADGDVSDPSAAVRN